MATSPTQRVMQELHRAMILPDGAGLTDGQLLGLFIDRCDGSAFEALVRRHGALVLGVCRRLLWNRADAEDAFQATFLVLARKAASVRPREHLVRWLYGVAHRTAQKARAAAAKRSRRERQVAEMPEPKTSPQDAWAELEPRIDQELSRLPEHYRLPIVLCDLEGKTRPQAARVLGCPEGTVSSRLKRGRALLARRLTRGGRLAPGAAVMVGLLRCAGAPPAPSQLIVTTAQAACLFAAHRAAVGVVSTKIAALAEGVLKAMLLSKLKLTALAFLAAGILGVSLTASCLAPGAKAAEPTSARADADKKGDKERLQGEWLQLSAEGKEGKVADETVAQFVLVVKDDVMTMKASNGDEYELTFKLDEGKEPKAINDELIKPEKGDKPYRGIYSLEGDTLKFCFGDPGEKRPTEFSAKAGSGWTLTVFKRKPKG